MDNLLATATRDHKQAAVLRACLDKTTITFDGAVELLKEVGIPEKDANDFMKKFQFRASSIYDYLWDMGADVDRDGVDAMIQATLFQVY